MLKHWEKNRLIIRTSFVMLVLFLFAFMMYPNMLPDKSFAEPGVDAIPSISIAPSNHATLSLNPGVFGSVSQTVTSTTTNYTGYVMTFTTNGSTTNLINTEDDSLVIPTITLPSGESSISPSGFAFNTYGYSLNNSGYRPVPSLNESQEIISTSTANVVADTSTLAFGAIVDFTAIPGSYQNAFLISATANDVGYLISYVANADTDEVTGMPVPNPEPEPTSGLVVSLSDAEPEREGYRFMGWAEDSEATEPDYAPSDEILLDPETSNITTLYAVWKKLYTIIYVGNDADGGSMSMVSHENVVEGDTIDLYASNFDRTGYGFLGWSFDKNAASTLGTYEQSVIYGPNEQISAPMYVDNEYSVGDNLIMPLFAVWLESSGTIQGWGGCDSLAVGNVVALTDNRDNNTYAVSKLSDDNCWMMENMRLNLQNAIIAKQNTNNPTDSFITYSQTATPTSWSGWGSGYWNYRYNTDNINRNKNPSPTNNDDNSSWYSYGVYYSWSIAMAGNETEKSGDLCPIGWQLPTNNEMNQFINNHLIGESNIAKAKDALKYPKNFILSGLYNFMTIEKDWPYTYYIMNRGEGAFYAVSNNKEGDYDDYSFYLLSTNGVSVNRGYAYRAKAVKCFAKKQTTATLAYDANGGEGAPSQIVSTSGTGLFTFTTSSIIPTRTGYSFGGWMDEDGNEASPNSTYISYRTSAKLYAIWINNSCNTNATTIGTGNVATDAVCLQDINQTVKSGMALKEIYSLKDARDNKEYTISLLDDGNVWMTQNLSLNTDNDLLLTPFDTDLNTGQSFLLSSANYIVDGTSGNYYNWATSIADSTTTYQSGRAYTSICPVGWDLPTENQYRLLQNKAGFNQNKQPSSSPYSFTMGGGWYNGTTQNNSSYLYLWTSSSYTDSTAYGAYNTGNAISISTNTAATYSGGASKTLKKRVRCIADNGTATITYHGNGSADYPVKAPSQFERTIALNGGTITTNSFSRNHFTFNGWNTAADGSGIQVAAGADRRQL